MDTGRACAHPGCEELGEFRAPPPGGRRSGFDGPGDWRWLCLDHVRAFNSGYNFFSGMNEDEIQSAHNPYGGWDRERALSPPTARRRRAGPISPTRSTRSARVSAHRAAAARRRARAHSRDRRALKVLGLNVECRPQGAAHPLCRAGAQVPPRP
jgi:hypothetical protein